jgi:Ca2+-binding EF-hand superfamily protein
MHNTSNWSVGGGVSPQHDSEVAQELRRKQYVNQAARLRTHAEHDVFHSSVGFNQRAPEGIMDVSGVQLQKLAKGDNPRHDNERQFIADRAKKSIVEKRDRPLINAVRKCANKLFQRHSRPHDIFKHYDANNTRQLNFNQFQQALRYVGCDLNIQSSRLLFNHYGVKKNNNNVVEKINYDFFIAAMKEHGNNDKGTTLLLPDYGNKVKKLRTGYDDDHHHDHFDVIHVSPRSKNERGRLHTSPTQQRNESINAMMTQYEESVARTLSPIRDAKSIDRRFSSKEEQRYLLLKSKVTDMIRGVERAKMMHNFARFDRSQHGVINMDNFLNVLHQVGIRMSRVDGERFFKDFVKEQNDGSVYDSNNNTLLLKYQDFTNSMMKDNVRVQKNISRFSINEKQGTITHDQARRYIIQQRVFDILKERKEFLARSLYKLDLSDTGVVDFPTFWKAIKMASIIISDADARRVFDRFDAMSGGKVMYEKITKMLGCVTVNDRPKNVNNSNGGSQFTRNGNRRGSYIPDPAKETIMEKDKIFRVVKQRVLDEVALVAPKLYQAFQLVPRKAYGKTLVDLSEFAMCIRTSGAILSENDTIALFQSMQGSSSEYEGNIDYMQFLNMLDKESSLKRRQEEPPVYIQEGSEQYENMLSSAGSMLGRRSLHYSYETKDFGIGLVPSETDNISRTGNLMVEQVLLRIVKHCDMNSNLLERAFIGVTGAFGEITRQDFLIAMNRIGVRLNQQETNALFKKLNPKKPTILNLNDLLSFIRNEYTKWQ